LIHDPEYKTQLSASVTRLLQIFHLFFNKAKKLTIALIEQWKRVCINISKKSRTKDHQKLELLLLCAATFAVNISEPVEIQIRYLVFSQEEVRASSGYSQKPGAF
jgi:hypothetical protein